MADRATKINKCERSTSKVTIKDNIVMGKQVPIPKEPVNVGEVLLKTLKSKPDLIGQVDALTGKTTTYADMSERSIKCALWLRKQGIKSGDRISLCSDNNLDAIVLLLGIVYVGAICNTWDHKLSPITARYLLSLISPKIIFTIASSAASLTEAAKELKMKIKIVVLNKMDGYMSLEDILKGHDTREVAEFTCTKISNPNETAFMIGSSGTTGLPKATEISHFTLCFLIHPLQCTELQYDVSMWAATFRWLCAITCAFEAITRYSKRIIISDNDNDEAYCKFIEKYEVTYFHSDPYILIRLNKNDLLDKYRFSSVRKIVSAGAHFKKIHQETLAKKLPHVLIANSYGMTDAGCTVVLQTKDSKSGSVGFLLNNMQMKITDIKTEKTLGANQMGEIRFNVPTVMNGYYKNPEATKQAFDSDGWLRSGDIGYYDDDGEIFIVDRISHFINFRSINVLPAEIEGVLQSHPAVFEAAVIGIPNEIDEQHPMAVVSLCSGKTATEDELVNFIEENMPDHCRLRGGVKFINKLPLTATRKIAKNELRKMFIN